MSDDAFDAFNRAQGQGQGGVRDPYPFFTALRQQGAVHELDLSQLMTEQTVPGLSPRIFVVLSHEAVSEALRDGKRFSSQGYDDSIGVVMGHTILGMDEPEHGTYRKILQRAFTARALERWERDVIRPVVHEAVDRFADRGRADLVRELTFPFPVAVIARMIGIPEEDIETFHRAAIELISIGFDPERAAAGSRTLGTLFQRLLDHRREEPCDDLTSTLAHAEIDGQRMSDEEIVSFLRLLAPAGAETTYRSSSNLFFALLTHRDQLEAVRGDRALVPQAIEEALRWEPPLPGIMRRAREDTTLAGVEIPAGSTVAVHIGSANRDTERYEDPERFDIHRPARQHMAFAFGPHRCLGMHLARIETQVVLEAFLDRLPNVRLDADAGDVYISGVSFRSPLSLPVLFDPPAGDA